MIEHIWQSTVCGLLAGAIALMLRQNRAEVRYRVWVAASLKFLVPFSALAALGAQLSWETQVTSEVFAIPADAIRRTIVVAARLPIGPPVTASPDNIGVLWLLATLWAAGSALLAARYMTVCYSLARIIRSGSVLTGGREVTILRQLERAQHCRRPLTVVSTGKTSEAGVFGIVRPVLLWPADMSARLTDAHIEAIFRHELTHVRRRDNLWAALHAVVQTIFWFCPVVWWIGRALIDTRETACDEEVIAAGTARDLYAAGILRACQYGTESAVWCLAGAAGDNLRRRMIRIMTNIHPKPLAQWQIVVLVAATAVGITGPIVYGLAQPSVQNSDGLRLSTTSGARVWLVTSPDGIPTMHGFTARDLVRYAYTMHDIPVVDGPAWIDTESFVVPGAGNPSDDPEWSAAIRNELETRFGLRAHLETRNVPVSALTVDSPDLAELNLRIAMPCFDSDAWRAAGSPQGWWQGQGQRFCGSSRQSPSGMTFIGVTMARLAASLGPPAVTRRVVDQTGLDGRFDIDLRFFPPAAAMIASSPFAAAALEPLGFTSVRSAMREQLGLALVDTEVPSDVLVIDRFERP